jgi:hypothetical protein
MPCHGHLEGPFKITYKIGQCISVLFTRNNVMLGLRHIRHTFPMIYGGCQLVVSSGGFELRLGYTLYSHISSDSHRLALFTP